MESFTFYTDRIESIIETKNGKEEYFIQGYASTADLDLVNDIVTKDAMQDMLSQMQGRTIKIDVEHESWRGGSPQIIPMGKIVEARIDEKGLWIKAQMNSAVSRFGEVWESVKAGFLDSFSIAFTNVKAVERVVDGVKARIITGLHLLNIALTGNPANPHARFTSVIGKSRDMAELEGNTMSEEIVDEQKEVPVEEPKEPEPEVKAITIEDLRNLEAGFAIKLSEVKALSNAKVSQESYDALVAEFKSLREVMDKPVLKVGRSVENQIQSHSEHKAIGALDVFKR